MPFYVRGGVGPIRYSHRLGRRRPPRRYRPRPVRDYTPTQQRGQLAAGAVILAVSLAVFVVCLVATL